MRYIPEISTLETDFSSKIDAVHACFGTVVHDNAVVGFDANQLIEIAADRAVAADPIASPSLRDENRLRTELTDRFPQLLQAASIGDKLLGRFFRMRPTRASNSGVFKLTPEKPCLAIRFSTSSTPITDFAGGGCTYAKSGF